MNKEKRKLDRDQYKILRGQEMGVGPSSPTHPLPTKPMSSISIWGMRRVFGPNTPLRLSSAFEANHLQGRGAQSSCKVFQHTPNNPIKSYITLSNYKITRFQKGTIEDPNNLLYKYIIIAPCEVTWILHSNGDVHEVKMASIFLFPLLIWFFFSIPLKFLVRIKVGILQMDLSKNRVPCREFFFLFGFFKKKIRLTSTTTMEKLLIKWLNCSLIFYMISFIWIIWL